MRNARLKRVGDQVPRPRRLLDEGKQVEMKLTVSPARAAPDVQYLRETLILGDIQEHRLGKKLFSVSV